MPNPSPSPKGFVQPPYYTRNGYLSTLAIVNGILAVILFAFAGGTHRAFAQQANPAHDAPSAFATMTLEFGSQGEGAGNFDDARAVAVDNKGHIYVGEYTNGRVQMFDATGKYLSEFSIGAGSYLQNIVADRNGTVYAISASHILRFTGSTGAALTEMDTGADSGSAKDYSDACLAAGGMMYAVSNPVTDEPEIVKLDTSTGKIVSSFDTDKAVGESLDLFRITVLPTGEIFALDQSKGVFQFSPDGRYVNRFGGKGASASPMDSTPAVLSSPQSIAGDSQGRIYISDSNAGIKVFDKHGNYIDSIAGNEVVFGIAIDDHDNIFASMRNLHTVRKYVINKH